MIDLFAVKVNEKKKQIVKYFRKEKFNLVYTVVFLATTLPTLLLYLYYLQK